MAAFLDVCRFTPTTGGTTDWTVSGAVAGYQTPAAAGAVTGTVYRYRAESADLTQWEVGYGAYTVSGTVLARTTVLANSSGGTSKINFTLTPQVAIVALAEDIGAMWPGLFVVTSYASAQAAVNAAIAAGGGIVYFPAAYNLGSGATGLVNNAAGSVPIRLTGPVGIADGSPSIAITYSGTGTMLSAPNTAGFEVDHLILESSGAGATIFDLSGAIEFNIHDNSIYATTSNAANLGFNLDNTQVGTIDRNLLQVLGGVTIQGANAGGHYAVKTVVTRNQVPDGGCATFIKGAGDNWTVFGNTIGAVGTTALAVGLGPAPTTLSWISNWHGDDTVGITWLNSNAATLISQGNTYGSTSTSSVGINQSASTGTVISIGDRFTNGSVGININTGNGLSIIGQDTSQAFTVSGTANPTAQVLQRSTLYAAPFDAMGLTGMQVNGSCDVSQESAATQKTLSNGNIPVYVVDQLSAFYAHAAATAVIKGQQVAPPGSPSFGAAFQNCMQLTATTAFSSPGSADYLLFQTRIEGYRFARTAFGGSTPQSVTIGFWIYSTIAGTINVSLANGSTTRFYVTNVVINNAATWEWKTITVLGDTTGTWLTTTGAGLLLTFGYAGSTLQGTANTWASATTYGTSAGTNLWASNNNTVCITGLVVLPGTEAPISARSPFIMRPYDQELILCRRYFRKSFPQATACAQNAGVAGAVTIKNPIALGDPSTYLLFEPTMRAAPTITTFNPSAANANWRDITAAADVTVSVDPGSTINDGGVLLATSGTVTTLGDILAIHYKADARL